MIIPILALLTQTPKTLEDLELLQIRDTLGLRSFYMEPAIKMAINGQSQTEQAKVKSDGKRFRLTLKLNGTPYLEQIEDGKTLWFINQQNKIYYRADLDKLPLTANPQELLPPPTTPAVLNITLGFPVTVQIASDPPPVLQSNGLEMEGSKMYRKVVISATNSNGDLETITEWFMLDRWILHRATITGPTVSGDISIPVMEFFERSSNKDFTVDPKSIKDFTQVDSIQQVLAHG
jgi:hypothetical protein